MRTLKIIADTSYLYLQCTSSNHMNDGHERVDEFQAEEPITHATDYRPKNSLRQQGKTDARTYPHTHNIKTHFVPDSPWDKKMFMTERTEKNDIHYTQYVMATRRKFRVPDVGIQ